MGLNISNVFKSENLNLLSQLRIEKFVTASDNEDSATYIGILDTFADGIRKLFDCKTKKEQLEKAFVIFRSSLIESNSSSFSNSTNIVISDAEKTIIAFRALAIASDNKEQFKIIPSDCVKTVDGMFGCPVYEFHAGEENKIDIASKCDSYTFSELLIKHDFIYKKTGKYAGWTLHPDCTKSEYITQRFIAKNSIDNKPEKQKEFIKNLNKFAILAQSRIRTYNARKPEDNNKNSSWTIRGCNGEVLGYDVEAAGHIMEKPSLITDPSLQIRGGEKTKTHGNEDDATVGLTPHNPNKFKTLDPNILQIIKDENIVYIIPQYKVSKNLLVSRNMGQNLFYLVHIERNYIFSTNHFKGLILDIEKFHDRKIIHRDIKSRNLFFKDGKVYLSDLDTMGKIGKFTRITGTLEITPLELLYNANIRRYGLRIDKISILHSMIEVYTKVSPSNGRHSQPQDFVSKFIKQKYQNQVKKFLDDPTDNGIPRLSRILVFSDENNTVI